MSEIQAAIDKSGLATQEARRVDQLAAQKILIAMRRLIPAGTILDRSKPENLPDYLVSTHIPEIPQLPQDHPLFRIDEVIDVHYDGHHPDLCTWRAEVTALRTGDLAELAKVSMVGEVLSTLRRQNRESQASAQSRMVEMLAKTESNSVRDNRLVAKSIMQAVLMMRNLRINGLSLIFTPGMKLRCSNDDAIWCLKCVIDMAGYNPGQTDGEAWSHVFEHIRKKGLPMQLVHEDGLSEEELLEINPLLEPASLLFQLTGTFTRDLAGKTITECSQG